jgi:predicted transcriptional regulator of viral defense system
MYLLQDVCQSGDEMNTQSFFATHPVFTADEFDRFLEDNGRTTEHNRKRLLSYHRARQRLVIVRPGLYGAVPLGAEAATYPVDSFLIAASLKPDAVIGYHSALEFHGVAQSTRQDRLVITRHPLTRPLLFRGVAYRAVQPPKALIAKRQEDVGIEEHERQNRPIRVTGLERTLVDCLDRPRLSGGWEEVWRSYESVPYLDVDLAVRYALLLANATTIASVGYFLELQQERWMVRGEHLDLLRAHRPAQPHYLGRRREERGRLIKDWNLMAPDRIIDRAWEETGEPLT